MHEFEVILYWGNEDQAFIAEVPDLPGCMARGDSQQTALKNVKDATQLWIDHCPRVRRSGAAAQGGAPDAC